MFLLIDTRLIAFEAYHRREDILIFFTNIKKYLTNFNINPTKIFFLFDSKLGSVRRKRIHKLYKAHRKVKIEKQGQAEIDRMKIFNEEYGKLYNLCKFYGVPLLLDGYEADDLANIICHRFQDNPIEIGLLSSDKDWGMNLQFPNVRQYHLKKGLILPKTCEKVYGLNPNDLLRFQALAGVAKENVKGIYRFGEKKFIALKDDEDFLDKTQEWVDIKKYGCKLPEGFETVKEMYDYNYELLRPLTKEDLSLNELMAFKEQWEAPIEFDYDKLNYEVMRDYQRVYILPERLK